MSWDEFVNVVSTLPSDAASGWRAKYIDAFIDTNSEFYKKHIQQLKLCSDGPCYDGYLWDCLKNFQAIGFMELCNELLRKDSLVMVMWDLHSKDKIPMPNYWKFPATNIIAVNSKMLLEGLNFLPEDSYIFDESLSWTLITTHEYNGGQSRICARAQPKVISN